MVLRQCWRCGKPQLLRECHSTASIRLPHGEKDGLATVSPGPWAPCHTVIHCLLTCCNGWLSASGSSQHHSASLAVAGTGGFVGPDGCVIRASSCVPCCRGQTGATAVSRQLPGGGPLQNFVFISSFSVIYNRKCMLFSLFADCRAVRLHLPAATDKLHQEHLGGRVA